MLPTPTHLYHGSAADATTLKPAPMAKVELSEEDQEEQTNTNLLYAAEQREFALEMGFTAALERKYKVVSFRTDGSSLTIELDRASPTMTFAALRTTMFYVYSLRFRKEDGWVKVKNRYNNAPKEWQTHKSVSAILRVERISAMEYLRDKNVTITHPRALTLKQEATHGDIASAS